MLRRNVWIKGKESGQMPHFCFKYKDRQGCKYLLRMRKEITTDAGSSGNAGPFLLGSLQFTRNAYPEMVPSAACLPLTTCHTLQFPAFSGARASEETWSVNVINPMLHPPLITGWKSQRIAPLWDYNTLCLCSWVFWKYFVGMKNPLVIATAWLSSSGLQH